jgi:hypothetical protein
VKDLKSATLDFEAWLKEWEKLKDVDINATGDYYFFNKIRVTNRINYEKAKNQQRIAVIMYNLAFARRHINRHRPQKRRILYFVKNTGISQYTWYGEIHKSVKYIESFFVCDRGVYFAHIDETSCENPVAAGFGVRIDPVDRDVGLDHFIGAEIDVDDPIVVNDRHAGILSISIPERFRG